MSEEVGILRDVLSRRDPHGYYVIPVKAEGRDLVEPYLRRPGVVLVEYADIILLKTRSRSLAEKIARSLARRGLLAGVESEE